MALQMHGHVVSTVVKIERSSLSPHDNCQTVISTMVENKIMDCEIMVMALNLLFTEGYLDPTEYEDQGLLRSV